MQDPTDIAIAIIITVQKWAKSVYNHAYFLYNIILNSIWFFHFIEYKSSANECIGTSNAFNVYHLMTKNCLNRTILFKPLGTEYVDPSTYSWLFAENIGPVNVWVI